jgi:Mlc titration factor MtfA (ptsG expression regulator)
VVPRNAIALSKPALFWSFRNEEPYHVGLHEFAHVLDMEDGRFDGVPRGLGGDIQRRWQALVADELARARLGRSVLDEYAGTNEPELFAVAVEHFFKAPQRLRRHHPELYEALRDYLNQDPAGEP